VPLGHFQGTIVQSLAFTFADILPTALTMPPLPAGSDLTLAFGDELHTVSAGERIEFGSGGVDEFLISGFDPTNASDSLDALQVGLEFASEGLTNVAVKAVDYINAADADMDGDVDGTDLAAWRENFGSSDPATHIQGDADGDQDVDGADFLAWQRQFGIGVLAAASSAAIPEPSAFAVLSSGVLLLCHRRKGAVG
jgi:hypothetical protein